MKKLLFASFLGCFLLATSTKAYNGVWQSFKETTVPAKGEQVIVPSKYQVYQLSTQYLKNLLFGVSENPDNAILIELPTPDGTIKSFRVWQDPIMEEGLAQKYPDFKTFTAVSVDNKFVTAKLDFTLYGFHAMVYDGSNTYFIDPYSNVATEFYSCYYKRDYTRPANHVMSCEAGLNEHLGGEAATYLSQDGLPQMAYRTNGLTKKSYRLALACTAQYALAVAGPTPTKPAVLSKMITSVNRVTGVYERELGVHLNLINHTDTLIFLVPGTTTNGYDANTNPYHNTNGGTMLGENQNVVQARIGSANYDIGHVFSTGGGGIAMLGCVCNNNKAQGVTGSSSPVGDSYDIDYVAHEMGHQFGGNHTFNANTGSCNGNGNQNTAYEPGSGTTIMAYAGICTGNDMQPHSDAYFHAISLYEITNYITTGNGKNCPTTSVSNNNPPTVPAFVKTYWIPKLTPFELTAPNAVDNDHDTLTYCWEQWNLGDFGKDIATVRLKGPTFRSFNPTFSTTRVCPVMSKVLAGVTNYLGEKLPDTTRSLTFKLTVRDIFNGTGTYNFSDDSVLLKVDNSSTFSVSSQNTPVTYLGSSNQTITWNVSNTNLAPVSCDSVEIWFSVDGGVSFPYLKAVTPNDGFETVNIPNPVGGTTNARVKVKGHNNVFFNVNTSNFTITFNTGIDDNYLADNLTIYPNPAIESLFISSKLSETLKLKIINAVGQCVWDNQFTHQEQIIVKDWAKGVYFLQVTNAQGQSFTKSILVQ
jgi:hypothetical protein